MKEFDYYSRNPEKYHDSFAIKRQLIEQIHSEELTTAQREEKLKNASMESIKIAKELNKSYFKESTRLTQEFWFDARESLGYHKWLTSAGVQKLESRAYEEGHAYGYAEVYSKLQDLVGFLEDIRSNFK